MGLDDGFMPLKPTDRDSLVAYLQAGGDEFRERILTELGLDTTNTDAMNGARAMFRAWSIFMMATEHEEPQSGWWRAVKDRLPYLSVAVGEKSAEDMADALIAGGFLMENAPGRHN